MIRNGARFNFRGITDKSGLRSTSSPLSVKPSGSRRRFACLAAGFNSYAVLGLSPFASKADVKYAYKRLALKHHPDVAKGDFSSGKDDTFREIKDAYESIMQKLEEEEEIRSMNSFDEWEEWDEWMGSEGGMPSPTYSAF